MADSGTKTIQSNLFEHTNDKLTNYALFAGGIDVTRPVLEQYDPFKTGYGRLFMIRQPIFMTRLFETKMKKFKHILEYGNTGVSGIGDISVNSSQMTGGYTGRSVAIPTIATDNTDNFTVSTYEFNGLPMREMLWMWINGVMDIQTGLTHYFGLIEDEVENGNGLQKSLANETAEFIYVVTDQTGINVQYACQFANCFPSNLSNDHFNYTAGTHETVPLQVQFSCIKYESPQINAIGAKLLKKYRVLMNVLDFNSKFSDTDVSEMEPNGGKINYDAATGELKNQERTTHYYGDVVTGSGSGTYGGSVTQSTV